MLFKDFFYFKPSPLSLLQCAAMIQHETDKIVLCLNFDIPVGCISAVLCSVELLCVLRCKCQCLIVSRCYMTLTTALHLHRGGSPKGPAGTGKTETVKDLGKSLGMYVIVVNCSEGLDYKSMGRMFSGLAQVREI